MGTPTHSPPRQHAYFCIAREDSQKYLKYLKKQTNKKKQLYVECQCKSQQGSPTRV